MSGVCPTWWCKSSVLEFWGLDFEWVLRHSATIFHHFIGHRSHGAVQLQVSGARYGLEVLLDPGRGLFAPDCGQGALVSAGWSTFLQRLGCSAMRNVYTGECVPYRGKFSWFLPKIGVNHKFLSNHETEITLFIFWHSLWGGPMIQFNGHWIQWSWQLVCPKSTQQVPW